MKKIIAIFLALLMILTLTACSTTKPSDTTSPSASEPAETVALKTETIYRPLEVIHEFSPTDTMRSVYEYDENGLPLKMVQYQNDAVNATTTYTYDETGNTATMTTVTSSGSTVMRYEYIYDDAGELVQHIAYIDDVLYSTTDYKDGKPARQYSENKEAGSSNEIIFCSDGQIQSTTATFTAPDGTVSESTAHYTYDENGNEIKKENYYNNGAGLQTTITEYDENNKKVSSVITDTLDGVTTTDYTSTYTYERSTETEIRYDADGNLISTSTSTYDEAGNLLCLEVVTEYSTTRSTYTYQAFEVPAEE